MFRATYRLERGKKRVCGWLRDNNQVDGAPNILVPGTFFSGVLREEGLIPLSDLYIIDDNNFLHSLETTPTVQQNTNLKIIADNNIAKLKEISRDRILQKIPVESQISGILSFGSLFIKQQEWIRYQLNILKEGISAIRNSSDPFMTRNTYTKRIEESGDPVLPSLLESVSNPLLSIPTVSTIDIMDSSQFTVVNGLNVIDLTLQTTTSSSEHITISNLTDTSRLVKEFEMTHRGINEDVIFNGVFNNEYIIDKAGGVIDIKMGVNSNRKINTVNLMCSESSGKVYMKVDDEPKKYIQLNTQTPLRRTGSCLSFTIPKKIKSIGPLCVDFEDLEVDDDFYQHISLPPSCEVSIERKEGLFFNFTDGHSMFMPRLNGVDIEWIPVGLSAEVSTFNLGNLDNHLIIPSNNGYNLELSVKSHTSVTSIIAIRTISETVSINKLSQWKQCGNVIHLTEKFTGKLFITQL